MKKCYGNYMDYSVCEGHGVCKEFGCFTKTNIDKGACDCKYKGNCHLFRQQIQSDFRKEENSTVQNCDFYKYIIGNKKDS